MSEMTWARQKLLVQRTKQKILAQCGNLPEAEKQLFRGVAVHCMEVSGVSAVVNREVCDRIFPGADADPACLAELFSAYPDAFWKRTPEAVGRIFQACRAEEKDAVYARIQKGCKVEPTELPAATQLFTPEWIVRYLTENSLGRLLLRCLPLSAEQKAELRSGWSYYEETDEPTLPERSPEEITVLDPCVGSGYFLVCAFDMLLKAYLLLGYPENEAPVIILTKNLYGVDVDRTVCALTRFALLMTAFPHDPEILRRKPDGNVWPVRRPEAGDRFVPEKLRDFYKEADNFGSLLCPPVQPLPTSYPAESCLLRQTRILSGQYDVVLTNPPYMGKKLLNKALNAFLTRQYPSGSSELYAAFINRCQSLTKPGGYTAMLTIHTWMFLRSFTALRQELLEKSTVITLLHTGAGTFAELNAFNVLASAFVLCNARLSGFRSVFRDLTAYPLPQEKQLHFDDPENLFLTDCDEFRQIPKMPFVYRIPERVREVFGSEPRLAEIAQPRQGIATADNDRFVRYWYEVDAADCAFPAEADKSAKRWFPYNKGGHFRRWYGMNEYVVNWENDGEQIRGFRDPDGRMRSRPQNLGFFFRHGITWSLFGFRNFGVRWKDDGFLFDVSGSSLFPPEKWMYYTLGFLSSSTAFEFLSTLAPTVNFQVGNVADLPLRLDDKRHDRIDALVKENIALARADWDSYEISWDFALHPLLRLRPEGRDGENVRLSELFVQWARECDDRFRRLCANETELNLLFAEIYGLSACVPIETPAQDAAATCRPAEAAREARSLISYGIGCLFGRYAPETPGLRCAGREKRGTGLLPLYGSRSAAVQLTGLLRDWFGADTLAENLMWLMRQLGRAGKPETALGAYLLREFRKDHAQVYQKTPIYWQTADRGRQPVSALLYQHTFVPAALLTVAREASRCRKPELAVLLTAASHREAPVPDDGVEVNRQRFRDILFP